MRRNVFRMKSFKFSRCKVIFLLFLLTLCALSHIIYPKRNHMFEIEFYTTENGKTPVADFLDTLPEKLRAKVSRDISLLETAGNNLPFPLSSPLGDGLFELRTIFASDIVRNFYFFCIGRKIIITNGFQKKTQKTPQSEITKARSYKTDYERRFSNEIS